MSFARYKSASLFSTFCTLSNSFSHKETTFCVSCVPRRACGMYAEALMLPLQQQAVKFRSLELLLLL